MSDADRTLLDEIISQEHAKNARRLKEDRYFEIFSAEQILKMRGFDVDMDQIRSGNVGHGGDGGIDCIYVFVNRKLVQEDTDIALFKDQRLDIELILVQGTRTPSFAEKRVQAFLDFTENCLSLGADLTKSPVRDLYNQGLLDCVARFHEVYKDALPRRPLLSISYYYVSRGEHIDEKVKIRKDMLLRRLSEMYSIATREFYFVGAPELLKWAYQVPTQTLMLKVEGHFSWMGFGKSYVCLARLDSFYEFITDKKTLRGHIFEANVRDFQGDVTVNNEIGATLLAPTDEFWWLNNGITILSSDISFSGDIYAIKDPLIVNGLQTSYKIYSHFQQLVGEGADKRTVLVRLIETTDSQRIDRIIKATNSQTRIGPIWLHATEAIHRKIASILESVGLHYDRRKNYHRNQGVSAAKIVTLPYLAQALTSIVLQRPDDARSRPTTAANRYYDQLFSEEYPIDLYSNCASIMKRVDEFLDGIDDLNRGDKLNVIFYIAMLCTCTVTNSAKPRRKAIAGLDVSIKFTDAILQDAYNRVFKIYKELGGDDRVAKSAGLLEKLKEVLPARKKRR